MPTPTVPDGSDEPQRRREHSWPEDDQAASGLAADFLQAVGHQMGIGPLTAGALARAVAELLPVDGVGIATVATQLRLPLAASTAAAEEAEELQTTLGDGPCLAAAAAGAPCVADLPDLLRRWPLYADELTRRTPYRSAAAVPLPTSDGQIFAALDLYAEDPHLSGRLDLDAVAQAIGAPMGALLELSLRPVGDDEILPQWHAEATGRRLGVWVAVAILTAGRHEQDGDALSVLRGYSYSHDRDLDDVAEDVVSGRLQVHDLTD